MLPRSILHPRDELARVAERRRGNAVSSATGFTAPTSGPGVAEGSAETPLARQPASPPRRAGRGRGGGRTEAPLARQPASPSAQSRWHRRLVYNDKLGKRDLQGPARQARPTARGLIAFLRIEPLAVNMPRECPNEEKTDGAGQADQDVLILEGTR